MSYWQIDSDDSHFSLHLCPHQVVDSTELCACLNGASLNIDFQNIVISPQNIMNPPLQKKLYDPQDCYDSQGMISPNYGLPSFQSQL